MIVNQLVICLLHVSVLLVRPLFGLTFTSTLSTQIAHQYRGQLLAYFTFVGDGGLSKLLFTKFRALDPSARIYVIPVGSQRLFVDKSESSCANFYSLAIYSLPLNVSRGNATLGSFTGHFPTFLAYADNFTCTANIPRSASKESLVEITIFNPNNQTLSGSLTGLPGHTLGLCLAYLIALVYTLYSGYLQGCCESTVGSIGSHPFDHDSSSFDPIMAPEKSFCYRWKKNARRSIFNKGNGIFWLVVLLIVQLISLFCFHAELSRLSHSMPGYPIAHHSVAGADGFYGHMSEMLAILAHFLMLMLLLTECLVVISKPQTEHAINSAALECVQPCCPDDLLDNCPHVKNCHFAIPTYSIFWFMRPSSLNRSVWILFLFQFLWYLFREGIYRELKSSEPNRWPLEEQHAFWGGWGLPNSNYLDRSSSLDSEGVHSKSGFMSLLSSFLSMSFLLTSIRSLIGLMLSLRILYVSKSPTIRVRQSQDLFRHVGAMGILWFIAHPSFSLLGILFADHIRYKMLLVGVSTIQLCVCAGLVYRYSRQHLLWDISSLASSLPHLRRIPSSGLKI